MVEHFGKIFMLWSTLFSFFLWVWNYRKFRGRRDLSFTCSYLLVESWKQSWEVKWLAQNFVTMRELGSELKLSGLLFSGPQMNVLPLTFAKGNSQLLNFFFFFTLTIYTMRRVVNSAFLCLTKPCLFSDRILRK